MARLRPIRAEGDDAVTMPTITGMAVVRCPGCKKWRIRVAKAHGRYATRRHKPCGIVPVDSSDPVRDVAGNPPGSITGSAR